MILFIVSALGWLSFVLGANNTSNGTLTSDPYLQYKPEFARSLPVQILVTGVVFTLVAVLLVHIVFTGQYHWPLAPVNYALQLSGVVTLLVSLTATIHVVLSSTIYESTHWPYMLSYIAVFVPPLDMLNVDSDASNSNDLTTENTWSSAERGTWLMMNATVSALVQITHIQFLTLLYPSRLEGRLIYCLLGPLAVVASVMQLIPIQANSPLIDVANDIRNVCNATLSLLFTASLFIWGLLVNRAQAWRTDGGTAVFGASALGLALISTALTFLYVPKSQEYVWLPGLIWAVILWQSFLGWWWWVGAGSGQTTEDVVEQVMRRGEKIAKRRRKTREEKARTKARESERRRRRRAGEETEEYSSPEPEQTRNRAATPSIRSARTDVNPDANLRSRAHRATETRSASAESSTSSLSSSRSRSNSNSRPRHHYSHSANTALSSNSTNPSPNTRSSLDSNSLPTSNSISTNHTPPKPRFLPSPIHRSLHSWYTTLRAAHVTAARRQTAERVERIREIEGRRRQSSGHSTNSGQRDRNIDDDYDDYDEEYSRNMQTKTRTRSLEEGRVDPSSSGSGDEGRGNAWGWGLGSFGWRMAGARFTSGAGSGPGLPRTDADATSGAGGEYEMEVTRSSRRIPKRRKRRGGGEGEGDQGGRPADTSAGSGTASGSEDGLEGGRESPQSPQPPLDHSPSSRRSSQRERTAAVAASRNGGDRGSMWWWGPLSRWRLQDSTVYR